MKRFIKNNLKVFVTIIITTIIVGSVSVYAASQYFAKDISFTPTNENFKKENGEPIDNVEDALNELYNMNYSFNEYKKGNNTGTLITNRKTTIEIEKGKYIMAINEYNAGMTSTGLKTTINLQTNNNITFSKISSTVSGFNTNNSASSLLEVYYLNAEENGIIDVTSSDAGTANTAAGGLNYILLEIKK